MLSRAIPQLYTYTRYMRAEFRWRQPLGAMGSNGQNRKRKRGISQKQEKDVFAKELKAVAEAVSRCVAH